MKKFDFLTTDVDPLPAVIRARPEDFLVEEVPLYEACGEGTHVYFDVEKRGLSSIEAAHRIVRALGLRDDDIGYAGLKDAHAVTRQRMSIEHIDPARLEGLVLR